MIVFRTVHRTADKYLARRRTKAHNQNLCKTMSKAVVLLKGKTKIEERQAKGRVLHVRNLLGTLLSWPAPAVLCQPGHSSQGSRRARHSSRMHPPHSGPGIPVPGVIGAVFCSVTRARSCVEFPSSTPTPAIKGAGYRGVPSVSRASFSCDLLLLGVVSCVYMSVQTVCTSPRSLLSPCCLNVKPN